MRTSSGSWRPAGSVRRRSSAGRSPSPRRPCRYSAGSATSRSSSAGTRPAADEGGEHAEGSLAAPFLRSSGSAAHGAGGLLLERALLVGGLLVVLLHALLVMAHRDPPALGPVGRGSSRSSLRPRRCLNRGRVRRSSASRSRARRPPSEHFRLSLSRP